MDKPTLRRLVLTLPAVSLAGDLDQPVSGVFTDSRDVRPGGLFVAIRGGQQADRHKFVRDAVERGACGVIVEEPTVLAQCAVVRVRDARAALAHVAVVYHGWPADRLRLVGVTGTNGKTTTALLLQHVFEETMGPCGYVGTLGGSIGEERFPLPNTTPEPPVLCATLRALADQGARSAVLEASSHGLALHRVSELRFVGAVFTNLSRDHLDFHGDMDSYALAKARLFEQLGADSVAVINADDPAGEIMARHCAGQVATYGRSVDAHYRILDAEKTEAGTRVALQTPRAQVEISTSLQGRFNVLNVAAAAACGLALGGDVEAVVRGIASLQAVPGRFEPVEAGQPFAVFVDYAHTPDALENVLAAARELTAGRVLCVFGCGGDRDTGKRPLMGGVVAELADIAVVTSDNPRTERPEDIIQDILGGMRDARSVLVEEDRRMAIQKALQQALPGDVVVVAGKGHEQGQIVGDHTFPFDDVSVVRELLSAPALVYQEDA